MGLIVVLMIVFVSTCVWYCYDFDSGIIGGFFGGMLGILTAGLALIVLIVISLFFDDEHVKVETHEISALKDNSQLEGNFFLASGSVDETDYYFYMMETQDGKARKKTNVDYSYVKEGNYEPHVEIYESQFTGKFARWFYGEVSQGNPKYVFYVPKGSVTTEIEIDME